MDTPDNPLGILGIDHLEFTCGDLDTTGCRPLFEKFGFTQAPLNPQGPSVLFHQGQIRFVLTAPVEGPARDYYEQHGEGVSKIAFLVKDASLAYREALKRGARAAGPNTICGVGDVLNTFVDTPTSTGQAPAARPLPQRFSRIDHLTNNVPRGQMKQWSQFYQDIYGFRVTRYFDIKGAQTGLLSEVVQLKNGSVIIPINEPDSEGSKSQIQEFLDIHNGPGVQHIALNTANITDTVGELQERGVRFLPIPHTYYEAIPSRGLNVEEDLDLLEKRQLLVDGDANGYLIQNFTETYIGPLFFEVIQRKNHGGFGEGNFQALFDAIEKDQIQRGYLK